MSFHPAETTDQVLDVALVGGPNALEARGSGGGSAVKPKLPRRKRGGDDTVVATA